MDSTLFEIIWQYPERVELFRLVLEVGDRNISHVPLHSGLLSMFGSYLLDDLLYFTDWIKIARLLSYFGRNMDQQWLITWTALPNFMINEVDLELCFADLAVHSRIHKRLHLLQHLLDLGLVRYLLRTLHQRTILQQTVIHNTLKILIKYDPEVVGVIRQYCDHYPGRIDQQFMY